ncbi:MAG: hypothetical protein JW731_02210 [Bacteroidales bacterium]|nr:hypothetical protein [Bacteroidales bacterium]
MWQSGPITSNDIVFLGDSLTESFDLVKHFGQENLVNRGMSGDMTDHVLYRMEEILLAKPTKLFLMIGINDIYQGVDADTVLLNIQKIIQQIASNSPQTEIFVQSILPVNETKLLAYDRLNTLIYSVNEQIQKHCKRSGFTFIDLYPDFLNQTGQLNADLTYDGVHLNENGYILWAELVRNFI